MLGCRRQKCFIQVRSQGKIYWTHVGELNTRRVHYSDPHSSTYKQRVFFCGESVVLADAETKGQTVGLIRLKNEAVVHKLKQTNKIIIVKTS